MSDLTIPRFPSRPAASHRPNMSGFERAKPGRLARLLRMALRTYMTRRDLPDLSPRQLADIGLSPSMVLAEAARLPWDLASMPGPHPNINAIQHRLERARVRRLAARLEKTEH